MIELIFDFFTYLGWLASILAILSFFSFFKKICAVHMQDCVLKKTKNNAWVKIRAAC
jgi:hypothetical protein